MRTKYSLSHLRITIHEPYFYVSHKPFPAWISSYFGCKRLAWHGLPGGGMGITVVRDRRRLNRA